MRPDLRSGPEALAPEAFLEHLRAASRRVLKSDAAGDLRCRCDMWTIGGGRIDPIEPLTNRGRRTITWPTEDWSSISTDLLGAAESAAESESEGLPAVLAEYCVYVHLELAAREDPPQGVREGAFVFPLVIAAREKTSSSEFRRYVLGWQARAGSLPWNDPGMAFAASLAVALGSREDAAIREGVTRCRAWLCEGAASGVGRFRDRVASSYFALWRRAASASAPDAAAWAEGFMR